MVPSTGEHEWLEADGFGGYAMGTASGIRRRRYHGLLVAATRPPAGRMLLAAGLDVWIDGPRGPVYLSSHAYAPDVVHPDGHTRLVDFTATPWPRFTYALWDGTQVVHELFVTRGASRVVLTWRRQGGAPMRLHARPLLAFRDHHGLAREEVSLMMKAERHGGLVRFRPRALGPTLGLLASGGYEHAPDWYRRFTYAEEAARGLDCVEDLASPGVVHFDVADRAALILTASGEGCDEDALALAARLGDAERSRRARFATARERAADAFVVRRGEGLTLIAGYPWFTDWGRDSFIALRGLLLATGRAREALELVRAWVRALDHGMAPNHFPEGGDAIFNSVDASLWLVVVLGELFSRAPDALADERLRGAVLEIVASYARGARHGIRADADGLLACGEPGVQLTWMDAKVGDWVVTPRTGKPVEVQALWVNALMVGARFEARWGELASRARASMARFWDEARGCAYDVVDVDHLPGRVDASLRPNQLYLAGGLPIAVIEGERARRMVDLCEAHLWTPAGPRSLAPDEPAYRGRHEGGVHSRDGAYHRGTVWPYLAGPFIEAWVRARGSTAQAKLEARARFFEPLLATLDPRATGHLPEIADGAPPHLPRGCPFQAWSLGEALRLEREVLAP